MKKQATHISPGNSDERNKLFPVFLKLDQLRILVVGGGKIGGEKLNALLQNNPDTRVILVSKEISAEVAAIVSAYLKGALCD